MAENKLVSSLVLRTIDIEPTRTRPTPSANQAVNNDFGICDANGAYVTWKNVNIRQCLGGLYNKYDRFNLKMTCVQIKHNETLGPNIDAHFVVYISGLPFSSGSGYNSRLGPNNRAALGCVDFNCGGSGTGVTTSFTSGLVSFDKPLQDILNISIELKNSSTFISNGYTEACANFLGHYSIVCDIYGIDKKK